MRRGGAAGRWLAPLLDVLLPHRCLGCGAIVDAPGVLCAGCWDEITFAGPPCCEACGLPFAYDAGAGTLCGECAAHPPPFRRARAAMIYGPASRRLILGFKHGDRTEAAVAFARWMVRAGADLIAESDLIAPVPLHWTRLFARRFNQAALLAHAIGRETGLEVAPDVLVRRRRTPSQGHLGRRARRRNVAGAFAVPPGRAGRVAGRRVLLIDDVMTTGATLAACARALGRAGAATVDALTLARVGAQDL
ncbi:MAG: ComF family protein [Rhodospirillales bacterium]|nr:ComF family protein [Rhodospirillales bacterium]